MQTSLTLLIPNKIKLVLWYLELIAVVSILWELKHFGVVQLSCGGNVSSEDSHICTTTFTHMVGRYIGVRRPRCMQTISVEVNFVCNFSYNRCDDSEQQEEQIHLRASLLGVITLKIYGYNMICWIVAMLGLLRYICQCTCMLYIFRYMMRWMLGLFDAYLSMHTFSMIGW